MKFKATRLPDTDRMAKRIEELAYQAAIQSFDEGAKKMKQFIRERGTGKTWAKPWGGRAGSQPGRVDSGDMVDAVTFQVVRNGQNVTATLGWVDEQAEYFFYQEKGFTHWISGDQIKGMNALMDAGSFTRMDLMKRLASVLGGK